jgi:hypothetical protein
MTRSRRYRRVIIRTLSRDIGRMPSPAPLKGVVAHQTAEPGVAARKESGRRSEPHAPR